MSETRASNSLLPLREKVAEGRMRGRPPSHPECAKTSNPRPSGRATPHPALRATFSLKGRRLRSALVLLAVLFALPARAQNPPPGPDDLSVVVTGASQDDFPRIGVQFELRRADGSFVRDATRDDFRVSEEGVERPVLDFQAPIATEAVPTTIVLVVDRSGSMLEEGRLPSLKGAVARFLEKMPQGSKVAVIAFNSQVELIQRFTADRRKVRAAVDELFADGPTRFFDAVAEAVDLLQEERGRRAIVALTDGQDTHSRLALEDVSARARELGLPVYTLGFGDEREIAVDDLKTLAKATRAEYYPARRSEELRKVYEAIAERIGAGYSLSYQSDRRIPDGTLRPVEVFYKPGRKAGATAVFIPGMVVPAGGWSPLFLALASGLAALAVLPERLRRRNG